jgi:hypothetical protein
VRELAAARAQIPAATATAPEPTVRLAVPEGITSLSVGGVECPVAEGVVHVPASAVAAAREHGCQPFDDAPAGA